MYLRRLFSSYPYLHQQSLHIPRLWQTYPDNRTAAVVKMGSRLEFLLQRGVQGETEILLGAVTYHLPEHNYLLHT